MTPDSRSTKPRSRTGDDAQSAQRPASRRRASRRRKIRTVTMPGDNRRANDVSEIGSESENPAIPSPTPATKRPRSNQDWWPNQLNLQVLHQHTPEGNPLGADFSYSETFKDLDVEAMKQDIFNVMTTSQDWWPA